MLKTLLKKMKFFYLGIVFLAIAPAVYADDAAVDDVADADVIVQVVPDKKAVKPHSIKTTSSSGLFTVGGVLKQDFAHSINPLFLNSNLTADKYTFMKNTVNLNLDYYSSAEYKDASAVQFHSTVRHKSYWGNASESFRSNSSDVLSSTGAKFSSHSHDVSRPGIWIKDLWLKFHLDKCYGVEIAEGNHFVVKAGFFPYQLGRGIALGEGYGTPKDFLGIYNRVNDYSAPGVLLSTKTLSGKFEADAYYALLEGRSASPRQTLASKKEKRIGYKLTPWAGSGNDDQLFVANFAYTLDDLLNAGGQQLGGRVFTYGLFNYAPAKKVELEFDSDSMLFTVGGGFDGNVGCCEFGFEAAQNLGCENMHMVDRNSLKSARDDNGNLVERYSHIEQESSPGSGVWSKAVVTKVLKQELDSNLHQQNLAAFTVGGDSFRSAANRVRGSFTNEFRGWMAIADIAWNLEGKYGLFKPAIAAGIASGDKDPSVDEVSKTYKGFIGLNELFSGNKVQSVIILDDRAVNRPMTITATDQVSKPNLKTDGSFTDLRFVGIGCKVVPVRFANYKLNISSNLLGFWKDHASKAITFDTDNNPVVSSRDARKFLGTEVNGMMSFEPLPNLVFGFRVAAFVPGDYYNDIAGARIVDDAMKVFEESDLQQIDTKKYSISKDVAYFLGSSVSYKF